MAQKKSSKKTTAKRSSQKQPEKNGRQQLAAILLFAGAVLVLFLGIIEGEAVWSALHYVLLGVFGIGAFVLPVVMIYVAVMMSLEKSSGSIVVRLLEGGALVLMLNTALHIFVQTVGGNHVEALSMAYNDGGILRGGGALGAFLGYPLELWFGDVCAKIVIVLLVFVFFMLVTGTTLIGLFRTMGKPVQKTRETIKTAINDYGERQAANAAEDDSKPVSAATNARRANATIDVPMTAPKSRIDIEMGEGYRSYEGDLQEANDAVDRAIAEMDPAAAERLKAEQAAAKKPRRTRKTAEKPTEEAPSAVVSSVEETGEQEPSAYAYPPISLLDPPKGGSNASANQEMKQNADRLLQTLRDFHVDATISDVVRGPSVTRFELVPNAGVKISKFTNLADDIAMRLATTGVRIEAPIPNKSAVGIEVPNKSRTSVCLRELIDSNEFATAKSKLTVALGKDISGKIVLADLAKMPHLLVAGTTGSGKSVCTNSMILSVLFRASPEDVRIILIDPKQVEFSAYNGIPHLLVPVVTDPRKAAGALGWAVIEMQRRYQVFKDHNVRDLGDYNELAAKSDDVKKMPQILIVIDELADLMMAASKEVEDSIVRLAQMARAAGMHMVIATQRPSADVLPGLVRSNIPSRIGLTVSKSTESRIMLDDGGAEKLLGNGDMLFRPVGTIKPLRVQGGYVSNDERRKVVEFLTPEETVEYDHDVMNEIEKKAAATGKSGSSAADISEEDDDEGDEMLPKAIEVVVEAGEASTSMLQRRLRLGYARAGRLIDEMEQRGIVGPHEGSKPRQVLISRQDWLEMSMTNEE